MDQNMPGHMLTLADRPIFRPAKETFWPAQKNLEDRQRRTFKNWTGHLDALRILSLKIRLAVESENACQGQAD